MRNLIYRARLALFVWLMKGAVLIVKPATATIQDEVKRLRSDAYFIARMMGWGGET